jgi:cyclopropane fatty-acyl-phospholipid synthase-like methyltransferase
MDTHSLNEESRQIWETLGPWWDSSVQDGDEFHRAFLFPTLEQWLGLQGGERVLDAGCGNGALARRMAGKGADVLGIDFSSSLIAQARGRSPGIRFEAVDLTDPGRLRTVAGWGPFDRVVSSMVLHGWEEP